MKHRAKPISLTGLAVLMCLMGCNRESRPTGGIIGLRNDSPIGRVVPDIPFASPEGRKTTFDEVRQPVAIVAFACVSSERCCPAHTVLRNLARRFEYLPVTVAQIYVPTEQYPNRSEIAANYEFSNGGIVTLYDSQGIAWRAFHKPKPNTVFLVDDDRRILCMSKEIGNLKHLAYRAQCLGEEVEQVIGDLTEP